MRVYSWCACATNWKHYVPGGAATTGWFLLMSSGHWLPLTPVCPPFLPPHSSTLLGRSFPNGDGGTLSWGLCGRLDKAVIWFWIMPGLINCSKSWPRRPGRGEILPLTSDHWHSGGPACGSQHEMLVTSVSLFGKLTLSEPSSTSHEFVIYFILSQAV